MPSAIASSGPNGLGCPRGTRSKTAVFVADRGHTRVSTLDCTPKEPNVRASLFNSCHSSSENIVFRAWRIRASIGASSAAGCGMADEPV
jgi:hypothetical protein